MNLSPLVNIPSCNGILWTANEEKGMEEKQKLVI